MQGSEAAATDIWLSIVAPAHNEAENVVALVEAVGGALSGPEGASALRGREWELVIVDDGSTDATRERLLEAQRREHRLRIVAMTRTPPGKGGGQSAAFWAGFRAARGEVIATLDADLQNDPEDIPRLIRLLEERRADLVQGDRSGDRRDNVVRRAGSVVGRVFRRMILGDTVRDTGCSLRVMTRRIALAIPLEYRGMHRFIPVFAASLGAKVVETPVVHRPRAAGATKYGLGVWQRAIPGLLDCFAVRWMFARRRPTDWEPVGGARPDPPGRAVVVEQAPARAKAGATR